MLTTQRGISRALCIFLFFVLAHSAEECDKSKCKGPLRFYEEMKCKPVYANPGDCCAVRYDCSHLSTRDPSRHCYANGREYNVRERLDNRCAYGCTCVEGGSFICAVPFRQLPHLPKDDCYYRQQRGNCFSSEVICPKEGEERPKCEVDGKTVLDGQFFYPQSRQDLLCQCGPGFKGELVEPFCWKTSCKFEENHSLDIHRNCSPVSYLDKSPQMACSYEFKCHGNSDEITPTSDKSTAVENVSDDFKCKYGEIRLNIGDKVTSKCVSCECEVPPALTCRTHCSYD